MRVLKSTLAAAAMLGGLVVLSGSTAASAATPNCTSSQIALSIGRANGAAGTIYYPIVFKNTGGTCVLWGVPAVQPVSASHAPVGPRAANGSMGEMPARHTLKNGQSVHDGYGVTETGNYPVNLCQPKNAAGIIVSLPGFVKATYLKFKISVCTKRASTHTVLLSPGPGF